MAVILDAPERGHMTILLQYTACPPVGAHCLGIGLQLQTLIEPCWQLKQELKLTEECVNTCTEDERFMAYVEAEIDLNLKSDVFENTKCGLKS